MRAPTIVRVGGIECVQVGRGDNGPFAEEFAHASPEFTHSRARKVTKWILHNAVSTISGPTEQRLERFLHEHDRDLIPGILQTLREFNPKVPA